MRRALLIGLLLAVTQICAAAPLFQNQDSRARYQALTEELRCVICLNQSIATSTAPLARQMRQLVADRIRAGDTDAQIKKILVNRYGTFVLYDPPFMPATWVLWLGPGVILLAALVIAAILVVRGRNAGLQPVAVDQERLEQILRETERGEQES